MGKLFHSEDTIILSNHAEVQHILFLFFKLLFCVFVKIKFVCIVRCYEQPSALCGDHILPFFINALTTCILKS